MQHGKSGQSHQQRRRQQRRRQRRRHNSWQRRRRCRCVTVRRSVFVFVVVRLSSFATIATTTSATIVTQTKSLARPVQGIASTAGSWQSLRWPVHGKATSTPRFIPTPPNRKSQICQDGGKQPASHGTTSKAAAEMVTGSPSKFVSKCYICGGVVEFLSLARTTSLMCLVATDEIYECTWCDIIPVSYTHLTLPTICSV